MFLLLVSKLINFVKNNETDILENNIRNLDLNVILNTKHTSLNFENKLNSIIRKYKDSRTFFTDQNFKDNLFNYDEKEFLYNENIDFLKDRNTSFLYNKKENYTDEPSISFGSYFSNEDNSALSHAERMLRELRSNTSPTRTNSGTQRVVRDLDLSESREESTIVLEEPQTNNF